MKTFATTAIVGNFLLVILYMIHKNDFSPIAFSAACGWFCLIMDEWFKNYHKKK